MVVGGRGGEYVRCTCVVKNIHVGSFSCVGDRAKVVGGRGGK